MGVKVAATCLHWSQTSNPHSPSSSHSLKRRSFIGGALVIRSVPRLNQSAMFGTKLYRSKSCDEHLKLQTKTIKRACSANLYSFSDEEFSKQIDELAIKFHLSNHDDDDDKNTKNRAIEAKSELLNLLETDEIIERKANRADLPISLRIIKRKKQWQNRFNEAGESAYCSVKRAFSSMVFIIQELQSFTLQMREKPLYEDLQAILIRVQKDMNASFVWLFQQVFSHTPTLMVYVMILLANYSVSSMAIAVAPPQSYSATTQSVSIIEDPNKFDSSLILSFSVEGGASIYSNNGGGGQKFRRVASGTDDDGMFDRSFYDNRITDNHTRTSEEEARLWNSVAEEASRMQSGLRNEALDDEMVKRFVSPVKAKIEKDESMEEYLITKLVYQSGLAQEPENTLLLSNYAQFLYVVAHDYDRAEEYFKRAVKVKPPDAEAMSKYATFLWTVRKDLWAAEETYLEAISADPTNSYYAANYAHFLWQTGGEDTCYPITFLDSNINDS